MKNLSLVDNIILITLLMFVLVGFSTQASQTSKIQEKTVKLKTILKR